MDDLPDGCVHLMITSPPYNVTKEYDEDFTLEEYRQFLKRVFSESYRVLADGGRACVNVANVGRKPYIPLHAYIIEDMLEIGFSMRGEIIWNKGTSAGPSTAWGSWQSASNPTLRDVHEYILVFSKGDFSRNGRDRKNTITRDEFLENTKSVWLHSRLSSPAVSSNCTASRMTLSWTRFRGAARPVSPPKQAEGFSLATKNMRPMCNLH